ncbi:MAG: hypothetical protein ACU836_01100 [Gammaproteobacteria bacterium]
MSEPFKFKPEPLPAKSKWHYDSYYLSQLERLNIRQPSNTPLKTEESIQETSGDKLTKEQAIAIMGLESERQIDTRDEVIKRIYELAASIGVSVTVIENPQVVA